MISQRVDAAILGAVEIIGRAYYSADEITVVTAVPMSARHFCQLPFDHLVFTGSTAVGRSVAQSAARNLTP